MRGSGCRDLCVRVLACKSESGSQKKHEGCVVWLREGERGDGFTNHPSFTVVVDFNVSQNTKNTGSPDPL